KWNAISPDLTTGCTGTSPNGARNCTISAIGVGGGTAVYTGSLDGLVYFSADAQVNNNPTWTRVGVHSNGVGDKHTLPGRPVAWIAVDRSNYRTAYLAYNGYSASTPHQPGHVYKYTITLRNIGSADATGVTITDPIPANTSFVSAQDGGSGGGGSVTWSGKSVPAGGSIAVHFTVNINPGVSSSVTSVTDDGYGATDAQGQSVSRPPTVT